MTRAIADTKKNWLIFLTCLSERFFTPRIPVNGIICVLQKVRAGFINQAVCMRWNMVCVFRTTHFPSSTLYAPGEFGGMVSTVSLYLRAISKPVAVAQPFAFSLRLSVLA